MSGRQIAVRWCTVPPAVRAEDLAVLDARGRRRATAIAHDAVRARHVAAWALLRGLLAALHGGSAVDAVVTVDRDGRPTTGTSTSVSIAHTVDLIVVAACLDGPVGVDVERRDRRPVPPVSSWCSPVDVATWSSLPPDARDPWSIRTWTANEATWKASSAAGTPPLHVRWLDPTGHHVVAVASC